MKIAYSKTLSEITKMEEAAEGPDQQAQAKSLRIKMTTGDTGRDFKFFTHTGETEGRRSSISPNVPASRR